MSNKQTVTLTMDFKMIAAILLATNILSLFIWKPWTTSVASRTISVSGDAVIEAEPDEFQFSPSYNIESSTKEKALAAATKKSNEVVDGLKKLGVADKDIKLNASSNDYWWYDQDTKTDHTNVYITIAVDNREFAQKVQDFLLTTNAEGQITPYPTFSETKQTELEKEARTIAIEDAKNKAQQSADELGAKVGKVVSVTEGYGGYAEPYLLNEASVDSVKSEAVSSLPVQPGEDEFRYSVSVVFEIK